MEHVYQEILNKIIDSKNILIISHRKPDADTLCSALALKTWIDSLNKFTELACIDKPASVFSFLPSINLFKQEFALSKFDLLIFVDNGAKYMSKLETIYPRLLQFPNIINIDHHSSNDFFGNINLVDPKAASTTILIYRFFKYFNIKLSPLISTYLLTGIYSDTGSFKHSNTDLEVLSTSSELMNLGANISLVSKYLYRTKPIKKLQLLGKVLENAYVTKNNILVSVISQNDYEKAHSGPEFLSGAIEFLNMAPDVNYAVLINEDLKGNIKGSLRTKNPNYDLSKIAEKFGGGGHKMASGFSIRGKLIRDTDYFILKEDKTKIPLEF